MTPANATMPLGPTLPGVAMRKPSGIPVPVVCDHSGVVSSGFPSWQRRGGYPAPPAMSLAPVSLLLKGEGNETHEHDARDMVNAVLA